ncbi:MAG: methylated-DNA--[protein]-cysteine S-methyltransferase [Calditrichaeota bacterium]|jgi:methylated-DNA-[protein]-cysteine S-methyltransferase|nr:methylated-DNA--[protein]-cysteine S-methyltransferase [Calditrichota bacterium]MBT7788379.1 methylated-DNA--[protein]-cysteine S-methyltransferase [Calditrichota bacterium]
MSEKQIVHYDIQSPIGELRIIGTSLALFRICFANDKSRNEGIGKPVHDLTLFPAIEEVVHFITDYFQGKTKHWEIKSPLGGTEFRENVWNLLTNVAFGTTVSYSELAAMADRPGAARAVGSAMANNPIPILVPCHRVLHADGGLGGFGGGLDAKEWLLNFEKEHSN